MKRFVIATSLLLSTHAFAQVNDIDSLKQVTAEKIEIQDLQGLEKAAKQLKQAEEQYNNAQQNANEQRANYKQAENEMEQARIALRKARLTLKDEEKKASPEEIKRYEVIMHPVFEEMSLGTQKGLGILMQGTEGKDFVKTVSKNGSGELKKYLKNYQSGKVKSKRGELFFDNIVIPEMSATPLDLFASFDEQENGVMMKLFFNEGTQFIDFSQETSTTANAKNIFDTFARYMRGYYLEDQTKSQEKDLGKLQKDLESYQKDIAKAKDDINKSETEIAETRNKITETEMEIDQMSEAMEKTRKLLSAVQ